jgi:hypothetical protein
MEPDNKKSETKPVQNQPSKAAVETYVGDMAEIMGENAEGGLIKKIIRGEQEHEKEKRELSPMSKKNKVFMLLGFIFFVLAFAIFIFLFFWKSPVPVSGEKPIVSPILTDQNSSLPITGFNKDQIAQAVAGEVRKTLVRGGGLEGIYLSENSQAIGLQRFLTLIESHFIPDESKLIMSDNFLMGVVKNQANTGSSSGTGFFILLKVRSTTDVFNPLRAWEPNLLADLHGFFGVNISSATNYLYTKDFEDGFVENKNARVLYDTSGNIILAYVFADDNSVIITDSQNAVRQIIERLTSGQVEQ